MVAISPDEADNDPIALASHFWRMHEGNTGGGKFRATLALMRLHQHVVSRVERCLKPIGLGLTDYLLLTTLHLSPNGAELPSRLARYMMVHVTTVTLATERLEKRELIAREPHPSDRRATYITITQEGRRLAHQANVALNDIDFGVPGLDDAAADTIYDILIPLREAVGDLHQPPPAPESPIND